MTQAGGPGIAQAFNSKEFRTTLGAFATGVTVVTTQGPEHAYGMTANAFSSVSLDPPLILICVISGTEGARTIAANEVFAVNILSAEQESLSRYFASRDRPRGAEAFQAVAHRRAATGSPILDGVAPATSIAAWRSATRPGDHEIFIGEVLGIGLFPDIEPLIFHGGRYRYFDAP